MPHLFGLQIHHLVPVGDSGTGILVRWRQRPVLCERMRHKRCCPCARGECGGACGKTKGEFQKMAAFHDIFLSVRAGAARYGSINRQNLGLFLAPNSAGTEFGEFISSPNLDRELGNRAHLGGLQGIRSGSILKLHGRNR